MVEGPDPECGLLDPNSNWQVFIYLDLDCLWEGWCDYLCSCTYSSLVLCVVPGYVQ